MGELSHLPLSNSEREPCQGHNQGSGYARIWELETVSGSAQTPTLNQSQVHVNTAFEEINQILSFFFAMIYRLPNKGRLMTEKLLCT